MLSPVSLENDERGTPRRAVFLLGAVAVSLVVTCVVASASLAQTGPQKPLTVVSWGGNYTRSQMLAYVQPFRKKIGEWVAMETYNGSLEEIREQVETENVVWDVVDFELADLIRGCREGLLEPIDHSILLPGDDGTPADGDFIPGALTECGVGQTIWSTVVAYDEQAFADGHPSEIADFFDVEQFPGKRGLRRDPRVIMEWALLADGVPADEVYATLETEEGRKRAFDVLDRIKRHVVWWTSGEEPVGLLDSGKVTMTSVWNGRMFRPIVEEGKGFMILWDGQLWDIDSWGVPKGTYNLEKAMDFIAFATAPEQLAEQAKYITYGPARRSSMSLVVEKVKPLLPTAPENMENALQTDAEWWATHHHALTESFEHWYVSGAQGLAGSAR